MPSPPRPCRGQHLPAAVIALAVVWASCLLLTASASASAAVTFRPGFAADAQLGESTSWTSELTFSGSEYYGQVDPLTGLTIHLPAGTGWSMGFGACSKETIEKDGWWTCPSDSLAGSTGSLTGVFLLDDQLAEDHATVQPVFGPTENLYFVVEAQAPVPVTAIIEGHYVSDSPPYGQALVLDVPRVLSVPGAPDMSTTAMTLNVGATHEENGTVFNSVTMPSACPASGFAWAATAVFNEEASAPVNVDYRGQCPGSESRSETTITLAVSNATPSAGETVTYTATVTPTGAGGAAPSGVVTFLDGGIPLEGCSVQPLTAGVSSSTATCQISYSSPGLHSITATYAGDENDLGSASAVVPVTAQSGLPSDGGNPGSGGGSSSGPLVASPVAPIVPPPTGTTHAVKPLTTAQKLAKALKQCKRDKSRHKRKACEAQAKKQYRAKKGKPA
jgi:hypothetical protein